MVARQGACRHRPGRRVGGSGRECPLALACTELEKGLVLKQAMRYLSYRGGSLTSFQLDKWYGRGLDGASEPSDRTGTLRSRG